MEVSLILHEKFISDFSEDAYGNTSVWERIKLAGADRYYRVDYGDEDEFEESTVDDRHRFSDFKHILNPVNLKKKTPTLIVITPYFDAILDAFVSGDSEAENQLVMRQL